MANSILKGVDTETPVERWLDYESSDLVYNSLWVFLGWELETCDNEENDKFQH